MSTYLLDKFLFTVDRDPELVERYREEPAETVRWWEQEMANRLLNCTPDERSTWLEFTDEERSYRSFLIGNDWCRVLPIAELTPDAFARALSEIEPIQQNPLDALAAKLKARLPELF